MKTNKNIVAESIKNSISDFFPELNDSVKEIVVYDIVHDLIKSLNNYKSKTIKKGIRQSK